MSTMILAKDYEGKKKGETVSVPFGKGRDMLKAGVAAYAPPTGPNPSKVPSAKPPAEIMAAEVEARFQALQAAHKTEVERLKSDAACANDEVKSAMDLAKKATDENADLKKQIEELKKPKAAK